MEKKVAVFHEGAIAFYVVQEEKQGFLTVHLLRYNGSPEKAPPEEFILFKQGRHWVDDHENTDMIDDLGYASESLQFSKELTFVDESSKQHIGGIAHP